MVRAWCIDGLAGPGEGNAADSAKLVSTDELYKRTGMEYFQINADNYQNDECMRKLKAERGYKYDDMMTLSEKDANYDEMVGRFYEEHLHADEEIRLVIDGGGYFDARDRNNEWIRVELVKDDLLILPPGIYHRFSLDSRKYFKTKRYFLTETEWTSHKRPADDHPARLEYKKMMGL